MEYPKPAYFSNAERSQLVNVMACSFGNAIIEENLTDDLHFTMPEETIDRLIIVYLGIEIDTEGNLVRQWLNKRYPNR